MEKYDFQKIVEDFLTSLEARQREILARRFGLEKEKRETLQAIGQDFGLSRERVRQIQNHALLKIKQKAQNFGEVFEALKNTFQNWGGLRREDKIIEELGGPKFKNHLWFLLYIGEPFQRKKEDEKFYSLWFLEENSLLLAEKIISFLILFLENHQRPFALDELFQVTQEEFSLFSKKVFLSFVEISKKIEKGPTGQFGLVSWPEITPRGLKDRAYLVLKSAQKPLHFTEITQSINEFFSNPKKRALSQSVHNELIKDPRFVLVGRGIYALKEWGYKEGTVKEIIKDILAKEGPLSKEEIVAKVKEQRLVQLNTILLALADKETFFKNDQGKYELKIS